jgi:streptogramin lyase
VGKTSYITAGSGNFLYFTAPGINAIEQFNPAVGVSLIFPIPTPNLGPSFITTGANGDLYFTATGANVIEQLDPTTHIFAYFPIPVTNAGATDITLGPGGNLWFVESGVNRLGEFDPTTRVFRSIPIPIANSGATNLTTGPNGNLYITEPGPNVLAQFNPTTDTFTNIRIPTPNSGAAALTVGPDGNIYFIEANSNKIGQFNLATHKFTEVPIPTAASGATGIAPGPDGNVYFTESATNKLGKVQITSATATTTQLSVTPNPSVVGQAVTLTATVTSSKTGIPTGTVTFIINGTPQRPVKLVQRNGVAQAILSTKLADTTYLITAAYRGSSTFAASVSSPVSLVVFPVPGDGPTVTNLARFGFHAAPTTLVLTFDKALDPTRAENRANYHIAQSNGRAIRVNSVVYDPSTLTVTIRPAQRLNIHLSYRLTVVGVAPNGLTDTSGNLLDGALTGHPGSNFVANVTIRNLKFTGAG